MIHEKESTIDASMFSASAAKPPTKEEVLDFLRLCRANYMLLQQEDIVN